MSTSHPDPAMSNAGDLSTRMAAAMHAADCGCEDGWDGTDLLRATAAMSVLPEFERQVRDRIVADLAAWRQKVAEGEAATLQADYVIGGVCRGLSDAIEIVQGKR